MDWSYRCMIVPAAEAQLARDLCKALAGPSGDGMFTTGLASSSNPEVVTHYTSAGLISTTFAEILPLTTVDPEMSLQATSPGKPEVVAHLLAQTELKVTESEIENLYKKITVTEDDWTITCNAMGLVLHQTDEVAHD